MLLVAAGLALVTYMAAEPWGGQRLAAGGAARQRVRRHQALPFEHDLRPHQLFFNDREDDEGVRQQQEGEGDREEQAACSAFPHSAAPARRLKGGKASSKAQPEPVTIRKRTDIARVLQQEGLRTGAELGVQVSVWPCMLGGNGICFLLCLLLRMVLACPPASTAGRAVCRGDIAGVGRLHNLLPGGRLGPAGAVCWAAMWHCQRSLL